MKKAAGSIRPIQQHFVSLREVDEQTGVTTKTGKTEKRETGNEKAENDDISSRNVVDSVSLIKKIKDFTVSLHWCRICGRCSILAFIFWL